MILLKLPCVPKYVFYFVQLSVAAWIPYDNYLFYFEN